ncbi:MAG: TRZ/ATZ family hydrolase [Gammaproteobacteria bacterium]
MQSIDTLIFARYVIPVEPDNALLEDHAIAIHQGRILAILPQHEAIQIYCATIEHRLPKHALIPGLVNAHTHAAMNLFKGLADDLPLMDWLNDHIWPAETRFVSQRFVRDGTQLAVAEMLRSGTTCFSDMYFFPEETARAAHEAGIRATVGLIVVDFPTVWARDAEEYLAKGIAVHDSCRHLPLVQTAFAPHAPYTVSDEPLERIAVYAEELDVRIHMHVHESADEVMQGRARYGERPLQRLERLGLLSPRLLAVHMTQLESAEIEWFAGFGAHVVHCPESNLKLASGFCPVARLLESGVNVALGTDSAASNDDLDMLGEMRTAALLAKGVAGSARAVPAAQALRMATLNGAQALGLEDQIGSLVPGKSADMVAINLQTIETEPLYHPISQLVYAAGRRQVSDVWIAGRHVLKRGALVTLDEELMLRRASEWRERIRNG